MSIINESETFRRKIKICNHTLRNHVEELNNLLLDQSVETYKYMKQFINDLPQCERCYTNFMKLVNRDYRRDRNEFSNLLSENIYNFNCSQYNSHFVEHTDCLYDVDVLKTLDSIKKYINSNLLGVQYYEWNHDLVVRGIINKFLIKNIAVWLYIKDNKEKIIDTLLTCDKELSIIQDKSDENFDKIFENENCLICQQNSEVNIESPIYSDDESN
jgi:hypothetical protein